MHNAGPIMYLRFAIPDPRSHALAPHGVFRRVYALIELGPAEPYQRDEMKKLLRWFGQHLPIPRTDRIGEHTIFWLKDRETPVVRRMWELVTLLRLCDCQVRSEEHTSELQ